MRMQPAVTGRTMERCHLLHVPPAKTLRVSCSKTSPAVTSPYVIIIFPGYSCVVKMYGGTFCTLCRFDGYISSSAAVTKLCQIFQRRRKLDIHIFHFDIYVLLLVFFISFLSARASILSIISFIRNFIIIIL